MKKSRFSLFLSICFAITCNISSVYGFGSSTAGVLLSTGLVISNIFNQANGQDPELFSYGNGNGIDDCGASIASSGSGYWVLSDTELGTGVNPMISTFSDSNELLSTFHMESLEDRFDDFAVVLHNNGNGSYLFGLQRDEYAPNRRRMTTFGGSDVVVGSLTDIPELEWAVQFNGTENDIITDIITTPINLYPTFIAQTESYGATSRDIQITQLTKDGSSEMFSMRIGGAGIEVPFAIRNTEDGFAAFAVSNSYSLGGFGFDVLLLELDVNGTLDNAMVFGSTADETSVFFEVDDEGNYRYAATTDGFGGGNTTGNILYGTLGPRGVPISNNVLLSDHELVVTGLDIDSQRNTIIGANLRNSTTLDYQAVSLKIDPDGTFVEASVFGEHSGIETTTNLRVIDNSYGVLTGCSTSYSLGGDEDVILYTFPLDDLQGCGSDLGIIQANATLLTASVSPTVTTVDLSFIPVTFNITDITLSENERICPAPTASPTALPTDLPTENPSYDPTNDPTFDPTTDPTYDPTTDPTLEPTFDPTSDPTSDPTTDPTSDPTYHPTAYPTADPTFDPTTDPTIDPTIDPTNDPTSDPTFDPTSDPTSDPTTDPTLDPTSDPTNDPTNDPTLDPTTYPTTYPTTLPTAPTMVPTDMPSASPTNPTDSPTDSPSVSPTSPTERPTDMPSNEPTSQPTNEPTYEPTGNPSGNPTFSPTNAPLISYYTVSNDTNVNFGSYISPKTASLLLPLLWLMV